MKKNKLIVTKSNTLIEAGYRLTLDEQRLILLAIGKIESRDTVLTSKDLFTVSAKEFAIFSSGETRNAYKSIQSAAEDLYERSVTFYEKDEGSILVTRWVSAVKYIESSGTVQLRFAPDVLPLLTQIKSCFTQYNLENISNLSSIHAMRTYELCLQYLDIGHRVMSVDEYKFYLGIEDMYSEYKVFNRDVLKIVVAQINKHTDIIIKATPVRELRKIVSLRFDVESKKARGQKVSKQKAESEIRRLSLSIEDSSKKQSKQQRPSFVIGESFH